jgi:multidrug efflux system outer membrane protein
VSAVAACTVGPDFAPPSLPVPERFAAADAAPAAPRDARWWQRLQSPQLDQLVEQALTDNRDRRAALARIRAARAAAGIADAARMPQVDAAGNYTRTVTTEASLSPLRGRSFDTFGLGFDMAWELDLFGRLARESEARAAEAVMAEADALAVTESLAAEVVTAYADLIGATQRRAATQAGIRAGEELLALVTARARGGVGSDLETASAERQLAAVRARMPIVEREWQRAAARLAVLTGRTQDAILAALQNAQPIAAVPDLLAIGLPADLIERRPDVRAAVERLHAAVARLGAAKAEQYPRLSIAGFFGLEANHPDSLFDAGSRALRAGPSLHVPLFDGGAVAQGIAVRDAQVDEAQAQLEQVVLRSFEEVENSAQGLRQERLRVASLLAARLAATQARDFAEARFRAGLSDFLTVLEAEQDRLDLDTQVATATADLVRVYAALQKALGGGVPMEPAVAAAAEPQ